MLSNYTLTIHYEHSTKVIPLRDASEQLVMLLYKRFCEKPGVYKVTLSRFFPRHCVTLAKWYK